MTAQTSRIDLHIHTTVSDGTDRPEELLPKIREKGIELFSVTDHDDIKACRVIRSLLGENDPRFLTGVEFSCRDEQGRRYHILGYGYNENADSIRRIVEKGHALRMIKVRARLDYVQKEFGFAFPEEEIRGLLAMDNPGKPHIAAMMVRHGYAESISQAIHKYINGLRIRDYFLRPDEAIQSILGAGGIPVLAHPLIYKFGDDKLKELIRKFPFTQIGKKYGVSDNAIKKWCIAENLPKTKVEINSYSDKEWELL